MRTSVEVIVEVQIARPPPEVWSFITDFERIPEWVGEFTAARRESDGPTGLGTVVRYTIGSGGRSGTFELVEWDPPHQLAWDGPPLRWAGGAGRPRGSHVLTGAGEGHTRLVTRYHPELSGTQVLLKPYLKRWLRRQRNVDAQTLKALIEAGAPS